MDGILLTYKCLSDEIRLRILNLLHRGPLCVCHVQEILGQPQVKISKQLAYMKQRGLVEVTQKANWRIYHIPDTVSPILANNLQCLQALSSDAKVLRTDLQRLAKIDTSAACLPAAVSTTSCCAS